MKLRLLQPNYGKFMSGLVIDVGVEIFLTRQQQAVRERCGMPSTTRKLRLTRCWLRTPENVDEHCPV